MERAEEAVKGNEEEASQSSGSSRIYISPGLSVASYSTYVVESEDLDDVFLPSDEEMFDLTRTLDTCSSASKEQQKQGSHQDSIQYVEYSPARFYQKIHHHHAMLKIKQVGQSMKELFSHIQEAIFLIDWFKDSGEVNFQKGQEQQKQLWLEWSKKQPFENEYLESAQPETHQQQIETLALARICYIIQVLKDIYCDLMPDLSSVPSDILEQVYQIKTHMEDIHTSFSDATSFHVLSRNALSQSREAAAKAEECLDVLLEYLIENNPLAEHETSLIPSESLEEEED